MEPITHKLFVAIPSPPLIAGVLRQLKERNAGLAGVRWVPEENLHITVFFLGFVDVAHIPEIKTVMNECLENIKEFTLQLKGIALEGARLNHPSMVWAKFEKCEQFTRLAADMAQQVLPYTNVPSKFPDPVPHITLARIKHGPLPDIALSIKCDIEFKGYELWRSVAVDGGVKYYKL